MYKKSKILYSLLGVIALLFSTLPSQAQSISAKSNHNRGSLLGIEAAFMPVNNDEPEYTVGAATRGGMCPQDKAAEDIPLTPLVSSSGQAVTVSERPTFLAYVPETAATKASLIVKDAAEDYYYQTTLSIPRGSGIMRVALPDDAPPLQTGNNYTWSLSIICGQTMRPGDPTIGGFIGKVEADGTLTSQLEQASLSERAALYGNQGAWYDTLTAVAELKKQSPSDSTVTATWKKLLGAVGLEAIASQPLLE